MPYPPAPWQLVGDALLTVNLVSLQQARRLVPPELEIVSVLPGHTLGGVYLVRYGAGSVLQYSELIVVTALVHYGNYTGSWISHIYVDQPESIAGGREIWGLPKQLAQFSWQAGSRWQVEVRQVEQQLCQLTWGKPFPLWQQSFSGQSFGTLATALLCFTAKAKARLGLVRSQLTIAPDSPLADLNLQHPWLTLSFQGMQLQVEAPSSVGRLTAAV